jgi:hypothetical protein
MSTTHKFAFKAFTLASTSPQNLLNGVNATWHEISTDTYGGTHHTAAS